MILLSACSSKSNEIIEGYSNCEEYYSDGFQDYIDYCKYFYKESEDKKFEENSYYSIVTKENIDDIKSYFDKFPYESMEDSNKYDFETDNINEGDYYSLRAGSNNDNYSVFLYDVNSHICIACKLSTKKLMQKELVLQESSFCISFLCLMYQLRFR